MSENPQKGPERADTWKITGYRSVSGIPHGFQRLFLHRESQSGTFPPISSPDSFKIYRMYALVLRLLFAQELPTCLWSNIYISDCNISLVNFEKKSKIRIEKKLKWNQVFVIIILFCIIWYLYLYYFTRCSIIVTSNLAVSINKNNLCYPPNK